MKLILNVFFLIASSLSLLGEPVQSPFVSAHFCLINEAGDKPGDCSAPGLTKEEIPYFKALYPDADPHRLLINPKTRIFHPLVGQSTSKMANQMFPKTFLETNKINELPNIIYWEMIEKLTLFGGALSEGLVLIPNRNWIYIAHQNQSTILGTIFFPCDVDGGNQMDSQIDWFLNTESDVAENLVLLAQTYGFDGYFINAESSAAASRKKDFGIFVEKLKRISIEKGYPLHVEWYVVGTPDTEDNVVNQDSVKITDSVFIDHFSWTSFQQDWITLSDKQKEAYGSWNVEYGAYNTGEISSLKTEGLLKEASLSYFTYDAILSPNGELLNSEITQDDNAYSFWIQNSEEFPPRSITRNLPFYSSFNTGKGKNFYRMGESSNYGQWNSIGVMNPLIKYAHLTENMTYDYEMVYNGGSSLSIKMTAAIKNIFKRSCFQCLGLFLEQKELILFDKLALDLNKKTVEAGVTYHLSETRACLNKENTPSLCLVSSNQEKCCFSLVSNSEADNWARLNLEINSEAGSCELSSVDSITLSYSESANPLEMNIGEIYLMEKTSSESELELEEEKSLSFVTQTLDPKGSIISWEKDEEAIYYDIFRAGVFQGETPHLSYWLATEEKNISDLQIIPVYPNKRASP